MAQPRPPSLLVSLVPALALVGLLYVSIALLEGSGHVPLIAAAAIAALAAALALGQPWSEIEAGVVAVKDLSTGEQVEMPRSDVASWFLTLFDNAENA